MAVLLIDNAFNLKINLGLIGQLTGITDCHCFTAYPEAERFLMENSLRIKVVFVNPNLNDDHFPSFLDKLKSLLKKRDITVRVLYKQFRVMENLKASDDKLKFTGMPITRNEIDLLKMLNIHKSTVEMEEEESENQEEILINKAG